MKIISFTVDTDFGGEADGYVAVPPEHPMHGLSITEIEENFDIEVHGGIALAEGHNRLANIPELSDLPKDYWVIGFNTSHLGDSPSNWPLRKVKEETRKLKKQVASVVDCA